MKRAIGVDKVICRRITVKDLLKYSAFLVLLPLCFSSCLSFLFESGVDFNSFQDNPVYRDKFAGIWVQDTSESGNYKTLEFKTDGTCSVVWYKDKQVVQTWAARYKVSNFQIVFSFERSNDVRMANYVIINNNNTLSLTNWSNDSRNETYYKGGAVQSKIVRNEIENALIKASDTVIATLQKEAIIAIINISSDDSEVSEFIAGELEYILVNKSFNVVDRSQLDKIRQEQNFQLSGVVDDNSAVSIGKFIGANIVITGAISGSGDMRRLRLRALDTQTARVVGAASEAFPDGTGSRQTTTPARTSSESPFYKIGDRGPAGGFIFYDKGTFSDGWRYLEAAPSETEFSAQWLDTEFFPWMGMGQENSKYLGLLRSGGQEIGDGLRNTKIISGLSNSRIAAVLCANLNYNGFNDWFLPSIGELELMYKNLKQKDLGGFKDSFYWSSSVIDKGYRIWFLSFDGGRRTYGPHTNTLSVRAIRVF